MESLLFWLFSIGLLFSGVLVVVHRNPVASALALVVSMTCLAALFVLLHAFFLATVQVLIYAGAVMVLFLFIIMLLDLKKRPGPFRRWGALVGAAAVGGAFAYAFRQVSADIPPAPAPPVAAGSSDIKEIGTLLFTRYLLPFEITSVLLLVAIIGVVLLSQKSKPVPDAPPSP